VPSRARATLGAFASLRASATTWVGPCILNDHRVAEVRIELVVTSVGTFPVTARKLAARENAKDPSTVAVLTPQNTVPFVDQVDSDFGKLSLGESPWIHSSFFRFIDCDFFLTCEVSGCEGVASALCAQMESAVPSSRLTTRSRTRVTRSRVRAAQRRNGGLGFARVGRSRNGSIDKDVERYSGD